MVFARYRIPPFHELAKPKLDGVPVPKVLTVVNQTALTAILTQISLVTSYANEIFLSLLKESSGAYERIKQLTVRTQKLSSELPSFEKHFTSSNILELMNATQRSAFTSNPNEQSNLLDRATMPESLKDTYEKLCRPPPKLSLLVIIFSILCFNAIPYW
jgi:hypothetical protein